MKHHKLYDEDEELNNPELIVVYSEEPMSEMPGAPLGSRRDEDVALDLMKFIAMTTNYGKAPGATPGFQGAGAKGGPEDHAAQLLSLYTRCLDTVKGKK